MATATTIETVKKILDTLIVDDIFFVDMKVKPTNNIKIFLDADSGLGIEKCIKINRALYRQIEEMALYPEGDFSLEVSSPGIDEPLKLVRQYIKNVGRFVAVTLLDGTVKEGQLMSADDNQFVIEVTTGKGKKQAIVQHQIVYSDVKQTIVQIKF
ncbi:ribosome maturation factor [Ferruginibacter yonginensis]|uniref:Ribosome maturation factor RimP n=1 Tax=Ferruginibacter yonginensis TaxID=1310416 RepID=A0ABV8QU19_9BACT